MIFFFNLFTINVKEEKWEGEDSFLLCSLNNSALSQLCMPHSDKQKPSNQPDLPFFEDKMACN